MLFSLQSRTFSIIIKYHNWSWKHLFVLKFSFINFSSGEISRTWKKFFFSSPLRFSRVSALNWANFTFLCEKIFSRNEKLMVAVYEFCRAIFNATKIYISSIPAIEIVLVYFSHHKIECEVRERAKWKWKCFSHFRADVQWESDQIFFLPVTAELFLS